MPTVKGKTRESVTVRSPCPRGDNSPPYQRAVDHETMSNLLCMLGVINGKLDKVISDVKVLELSHMLQMEAHEQFLSQIATVLMNLRPMLTVERFGADAQGFVDLFPANTVVVPFAEIVDNSSDTARHTSNIIMVADELLDSMSSSWPDDDDDGASSVDPNLTPTTETPPTTPSRYLNEPIWVHSGSGDTWFDLGDPMI